MRLPVLLTAIFVITCAGMPLRAEEGTAIGSINTTWRLLGPDDKITITRYDDPKVSGASCYISRAETGGIKGGLGLAEDPSRFSIACRATGPIKIIGNLPKGGEIVFTDRASIFFKTIQIWRHLDAEKNVLIYTVTSTKLVNGSPYNAITAIPIN